MIKLHKLSIEEIGDKEHIIFDDRLLKKRFGTKWHMLDKIQFTKGVGDVMKHQRIFVVEEIERR